MTSYDDSGPSSRKTGGLLTQTYLSDASDDHLAALPRGTMLFEYRVDAVLGHGGFGITYLAEDTLLNEAVAIKEFFPSHTAIRTGDQSAKARSSRDADAFRQGVDSFLNEARIIARFRHSNIMQVRRFFEAHGTGYMVLDFVHGRSLEAALADGPLPEPHVRTILSGIVDGLAALHDRAILHRDLKPRNIILRQDGSPVLIDFGAARDFGFRHSTTITQIVSPNYSSPEQYGVGPQQGPWSDYYSLGAILYRSVTGIVPNDALRRLRADPLEPASTLAAGRYDPALLRLVDTLLSVEAEARPRDAAAIRAFAEGTPVRPEMLAGASAPPESATSGTPAGVLRSRWKGAAAILLVLLVIGVVSLSWLFWSAHQAGDPAVVANRASPQIPAEQQNAAVAPQTPAPVSTPHASDPAQRTRPADLKMGSTFSDCAHCPTMTVVPAGSFAMGSSDNRSDEKPVHEVTFQAPFAIGQREVTVQDWKACVEGGGCENAPESRTSPRDDDPVTNLSWLDTQAYVTWLSKVAGHPYRLPSEAEWEYAARGGSSEPFWWGDAVGSGHANCTECGTQSSAGTALPTGSFPPNRFGLYDTAGNAAEWVEDCWTPDYQSAPNDGHAVETPGCLQHVIRGGSFSNGARYLRSTTRFKYDTAVRYYANGFRVATDVAQP